MWSRYAINKEIEKRQAITGEKRTFSEVEEYSEVEESDDEPEEHSDKKLKVDHSVKSLTNASANLISPVDTKEVENDHSVESSIDSNNNPKLSTATKKRSLAEAEEGYDDLVESITKRVKTRHSSVDTSSADVTSASTTEAKRNNNKAAPIYQKPSRKLKWQSTEWRRAEEKRLGPAKVQLPKKNATQELINELPKDKLPPKKAGLLDMPHELLAKIFKHVSPHFLVLVHVHCCL